jgi:hypothetical protein
VSGEPTRKSIPAVWRDAIRGCPRDELDAKARVVALVLSTYMNARGEIVDADPRRRVTRATIAAGCALSDRSVDAAVAALEQTGWLAVDPPARRRIVARGGVETEVLARPGGASGPNKYVATLGPSANEIRTAEWSRAKEIRTADAASAKLTPPSAKTTTPECERPSHESSRSKAIESEFDDDAAQSASPTTEPDWLDRCYRCDSEIPHRLLTPDGLCESCAG